MHTRLRQLLSAATVVTTDDLRACGYDSNAVRRLLAAGVLRRVHRGVMVDAVVWDEATSEERHRLRCRAVLLRYRDVALSHVSAIVAHGLPVFDARLDLVHLSRIDAGRPRRRGAVQVHPRLPGPAVVRTASWPPLPVCTIAVAVLQTADWDGLDAGMVAAEAALHRGLVTAGELQRARAVARLGRGRAAADLVVALAGPHSESPGETRTRLLLRSLGWAMPTQQATCVLPEGGAARVDFLLKDEGVVVEFDGAVKYGGATGRGELVREKRREDGLRAIGLEVVRLTWTDLARPSDVARLLQAAVARSRQRRSRQ